jgi:hypothetical protein
MRWYVPALVVFVAAGSAVRAAVPFRQQDEPRTVKAAIAEGLRLLEAKDVATFLKTFMKPTDLTEHLSKFGTMEKLTAALSRHKESALLLEKFRAASKVEPTFSGDGVRANFPFDAVIGNDRRLQLEKIGDRWYLND